MQDNERQRQGVLNCASWFFEDTRYVAIYALQRAPWRRPSGFYVVLRPGLKGQSCKATKRANREKDGISEQNHGRRSASDVLWWGCKRLTWWSAQVSGMAEQRFFLLGALSLVSAMEADMNGLSPLHVKRRM